MRVRPYRRGLLLLLFALSAPWARAQSFLLGDTRGLLGEAEREYLEREMAGATSEQEVEAALRAALIGLDHGQVTYLVKEADDRWRERVYSVGQGRSAPALTATLSSRGVDEPLRTRASLRALFKDTLVVLDTLRVRLELDPPLPLEEFRLYWAGSSVEPVKAGLVFEDDGDLLITRGSFPGHDGNDVELFLKHSRWPKEAMGPCHLKFLGAEERSALQEVWCGERDRVPDADPEQAARFLHDLVDAWYGRCHAPRSTGFTCP